MPDYKLLPAGDTALVVEFGDRVDRGLSARVIALANRLNDRRIDGVVEIVPTFRSLMVHYEPLVVSQANMAAYLAELLADLRPCEQAGRLWRLPVCYDASLAPDLGDVASRTGLPAQQVVERHCAETYHVYMLGFLPGQAYMGDVPRELELPRRPSPRPAIPAGSLAIARGITCIFPLETPSGWHVIGRSPVPLWDRRSGQSPLLQPNDKVRFAPVSLREYDRLLASEQRGESDPLSPVEVAA